MMINVNLYLHGLDETLAIQKTLTEINRLCQLNLNQGKTMTETVDTLVELTTQVAGQMVAISDAVTPIAPAIDTLEAKITAALAALPPGTIPADAQAKIDTAVATLRGVVTQATDVITKANAIVADATDGIDEAAAIPPV